MDEIDQKAKGDISKATLNNIRNQILQRTKFVFTVKDSVKAMFYSYFKCFKMSKELANKIKM